MGQNFLQQLYHMKTDFYKIYNAGCSEKYPNYENLLRHCCNQVKCSASYRCVYKLFQLFFQSHDHLKPIGLCISSTWEA